MAIGKRIRRSGRKRAVSRATSILPDLNTWESTSDVIACPVCTQAIVKMSSGTRSHLNMHIRKGQMTEEEKCKFLGYGPRFK